MCWQQRLRRVATTPAGQARELWGTLLALREPFPASSNCMAHLPVPTWQECTISWKPGAVYWLLHTVINLHMLNRGIEVERENLAFDYREWFSREVKANLWQSTNWEIPDVSHITANLWSSSGGSDAEIWAINRPHMLSISSRMGQGIKLARQCNRLQAWHFRKVHLPEVPRMGWCCFECAAFLFQKLLAQNSWGRDNMALPARKGEVSL